VFGSIVFADPCLDTMFDVECSPFLVEFVAMAATDVSFDDPAGDEFGGGAGPGASAAPADVGLRPTSSAWTPAATAARSAS